MTMRRDTPLAMRRDQAGFSMIEALVSLVILLLGLLGLAGMMIQSQRAQTESYQRAQAVILLQDMVGRINANRKVAPCYAVSGASTGEPFLGSGATLTPTCTLGTSEQYLLAIQDMTDWSDLLSGSSETKGSANAGAMIGARGCISLDATTSPPTYKVSVAWQGLSRTAAPPADETCGTGLYGNETERRVISATLQIATLDAL